MAVLGRWRRSSDGPDRPVDMAGVDMGVTGHRRRRLMPADLLDRWQVDDGREYHLGIPG
jgi:hypothetical protein